MGLLCCAAAVHHTPVGEVPKAGESGSAEGVQAGGGGGVGGHRGWRDGRRVWGSGMAAGGLSACVRAGVCVTAGTPWGARPPLPPTQSRATQFSGTATPAGHPPTHQNPPTNPTGHPPRVATARDAEGAPPPPPPVLEGWEVFRPPLALGVLKAGGRCRGGVPTTACSPLLAALPPPRRAGGTGRAWRRPPLK